MPDLWQALAARPELARTLARHAAAFETGTIDRRTHELCALMVAWLNACEGCLRAHGEVASALGIDAQTLAELGEYARSDRFSAAERAALAAAVALTREPRALPLTVRAQLAGHYSREQIVEIVAIVGLYNYLTRASNALRTIDVP